MPTKRSSPPRLKWHNTLPADFTSGARPPRPTASVRSASTSSRKRQPATHDNVDAGVHSHFQQNSSPIANNLSTKLSNSNVFLSPTKRQRPLSANANTRTPTKLRPFGGSPASSRSGMQTPPPSSTGTARKRGRAPKNMSSKIHSRTISSPLISPTKMKTAVSSSQIPSGQREAEMENMEYVGSKPISNPVDPADIAQSSIFWDSGFEYAAGLGIALGKAKSSRSVNWHSIRNSFGEDIGDLFGESSSVSLSKRARESSPYIFEPNDCPHFSFTQYDEPDALHLGVDPNLIFSSATSAASSMAEEYSAGANFPASGLKEQPYQHQLLQLHKEKELAIRRKAQLQEKNSGSGKQPELSLKHSISDSMLTHHNPSSLSMKTSSYNVMRSRSVRDSRANGFHNNENIEPRLLPQNKAINTAATNLANSMPKNPRTRTEVVLAISPGGRAKTETNVIYEESETEVDEPINEWDSLEESDSSFDDDRPRGLGPDGREYVKFRKRRIPNPSLEQPKPSRYYNSHPAKKSLPVPKTPTRQSPTKHLDSASGFGFAANTNAAGNGVVLGSSPRLPTPVQSSPPTIIAKRPTESVRRVSASSMNSSATMSLKAPSMRMKDAGGDESEAETVVDAIDLEETEDQGDALCALKRALARKQSNKPSNFQPTDIADFRRDGNTTPTPRRSRTQNHHHHRPLSPSPIKKPFLPLNRFRSLRRRKIADGGFPEDIPGVTRDISPTTVTDPDYISPSEEYMEDENPTRCTCGRMEDGGTTMVQCDSCTKWLHLNCTGLSRKTLPKTFICAFCIRDRRMEMSFKDERKRIRAGGRRC